MTPSFRMAWMRMCDIFAVTFQRGASIDVSWREVVKIPLNRIFVQHIYKIVRRVVHFSQLLPVKRLDF